MMRFSLIIPFILACTSIAGQKNTPEVEDLLAQSISYHDPTNQWHNLSTTLTFKETRLKGAPRSTVIEVDNNTGYVKINRNDSEIYLINQEESEVLKGDKEKERGILLRNYYLYLWGLPMKLKDESTPEITIAGELEIKEEVCNILRVAYERDTWYFYLSAASGKLMQYAFYQDKEETRGELITLEDELIVQGMKIPKKRTWFVLPNMDYLGTDELVSNK